MINSPYAKAILATIVATIGALVTALGPGSHNLGDLTTQTWLVAVGSILSSGALVWWTENGPWHPYIKTVLASAGAFVTSLITAFNDGVVTQGELLTAISAAIVATGLVMQAANTPAPPAP
jgi:hypothetical protein